MKARRGRRSPRPSGPRPCRAQAPLAPGAGRAGGAGPEALPGPGRRPARHGQVDPGPRPGRAGRLHRDPLGRGAQGTGRPSPTPAVTGGLRGGDLHARVDRADLRRVPAPGRGALFEGSASSWTRASARRRSAPPLPRGGHPLGRAGGPPALPGRAGRGAGAARNAAGTTPPTPTGRSTRRPSDAGKSPARGRAATPGRSPPAALGSSPSRRPSMRSGVSASWIRADVAHVGQPVDSTSPPRPGSTQTLARLCRGAGGGPASRPHEVIALTLQFRDAARLPEDDISSEALPGFQ